jgi:quinol-cytochrome oxidoreductase complex cytochrome b subunit
MTLPAIVAYFSIMTTTYAGTFAVFGFFTLLIVSSQLITGTMLSFSLIPESMMVSLVRDEEDAEVLYIDDYFWLHERGVDLTFIFSYIHLLRKLYINAFEFEQAAAWKSGVFTFLIFQVVVFCGLVLCCTHLSEITLTIAANILHTFFMFKTKAYWWFFTDKQLNTDTMIRIAYAHYVAGFYMFYLAVIHALDMHHDWKSEASYDGVEAEIMWWDEVFSFEVMKFVICLLTFTFFCYIWYEPNEALSYEIFMWGDIGLVPDVRYYGVAPHWYFRPFMAWLIACPYHKTGIFGLIFFFFVLFFQYNLHGVNEQNYYNTKPTFFFGLKYKKTGLFSQTFNNVELNSYYNFFYFLFIGAFLYTTSSLPYGRFYNRVGGNIGMLLAYLYVFSYLAFTFFRRAVFVELLLLISYNKLNLLQHTTASARI